MVLQLPICLLLPYRKFVFFAVRPCTRLEDRCTTWSLLIELDHCVPVFHGILIFIHVKVLLCNLRVIEVRGMLEIA